MPTAYGYCRVSTDKQGELGLDSQKKCITDLWEKHLKEQYPKLEFFIDADVSARQNDFSRRPQAKSLALHLTKDDALIFSKLDRGFRSLRDMLNMLDFWDRTGVRVFCPDFGIGSIYDSKSMIGKMAMVCFGLVAEMEGMRCSQRTHDFNRSQIASGRSTNHAVFGFKNVRRGQPTGAKRRPPAYLQPHDDEQETARFIVANRRKGIGFTKIADHLNSNGISKRKGVPWDHEGVKKVYLKWIKILEWEKQVYTKRGYPLKEWEFMSPHGTILTRFDKEHLKETSSDTAATG